MNIGAIMGFLFLSFVHSYFYKKLTIAGEVVVPVPLLNGTYSPDIQNINTSSILRYGHHKVQDCQDFKKSYICIMQCLERGYQIARSNKQCECTCFHDYTKAKYFPNVTKGWKVPTTSLPPWAVEITTTVKNNYVKLIGDKDQGIEEEDNGESTESTNTITTSTHENSTNTVNVEMGISAVEAQDDSTAESSSVPNSGEEDNTVDPSNDATKEGLTNEESPDVTASDGDATIVDISS